MSKIKTKTEKKILPLQKQNYILIAIGLLLIALGYIALAQEPWDGFMPLTISPILLITGYCVFVPIGILWRKKNNSQ